MPSAESVKTSNQQQEHHEFADSEPPLAQHLAQPVISVVGRKPWLTKFGGEEGYELWRHQLLSLRRENHSSQDIADAIRASLQCKAGSLLVSLGPDATVDEILTKLDSIYGQVDEDADVLAAFYSARQGQAETVADWSCRIEGLFGRVRRLSDINGGTDEALRQMFWTGPRQELKDASAYQFDTIKSFDEVRKAIRRVEKQHPLAPVKTEKKTVCNVTQSQPRKDHSESLEAMVKQLSSELKALKQEIKSVHSKKPADTQHSERKDHYQSLGQNRQMSSNNQASDNPAWCQGRQNSWQGGRIRDNRQRGEVVCYRCGEPAFRAGHLQGKHGKPQCHEQFAQEDTDITDLIGTANETSVGVEGIETVALLDTGSSVSTVGDEKQRQANSAPSRKNRSQAQRVPLPRLNTLVAKSRGPGGDTSHIVTTNFAGYSTKDQEASPTRYTRFASTWAQVRAENHIDMCAPASPEGVPRKKGHGEDQSGARSISDESAVRHGHPTGRLPDQEIAKGNNIRTGPDHVSPGPSSEMELISPRKQNEDPTPYTKTYSQTRKKHGEDREKQAIRFEVCGNDQFDNGQQNDEVPTDTSHAREPKSIKKRPEWNNRLALSVPQPSQITAKSWRRYEAELTHIPNTTSTRQVYKVYTGRSKQQLRGREVSDNDGCWLEQRTSTRSSLQEEEHGEMKDSSFQSSKEHILTRNEAKMFLHLQNVYGSEAYRQHRKECFFKKLTNVQLEELQRQAEDKRKKRQRTEESKKRQKRQLMYVRRKFRREQLHRFRTQYVTSRILEYEKWDRDIYGLPGDQNDDVRSVDDVNGSDKDESASAAGDSCHLDKDTNKTATETISKRGMKYSQTHIPQSEQADKSLSGAPVTSSNMNDTLNTGPGFKGKSNATRSKTAASTDSTQVNQPNATMNSKQSSNNDQTSNSEASKPAFSSDDDDTNRPNNTRANMTKTGKKAPGSMAKTKKCDPEQTTRVKDTVTPVYPNRNTTNTHSSVAILDGKPGAATESFENVASLSANNTNDFASGAKNNSVAVSPPKGTSSSKANVKNENQPTERNSMDKEKKGRGDGTPRKDQNGSFQNKNDDMKKAKTGSPDTKKNENEHNDLPTKLKQNNALSKVKDRGVVDNKQTAVSYENKELNVTTAKKSGSKDPPDKTASREVPPNDRVLKGHVFHSSHQLDSNEHIAATSPARTDANKKSSGGRQANSHGLKSAKPQPKNKAEEKKQLERKYGKMFEVNTGPSWNPRANTPKMEGIDTVMVRVTDEKGRTRLKKRGVTDVVKEAEAQLAQPDQVNHRRSTGSGDFSAQATPHAVRPASADTLDFNEDEDDDEEDVFERVRRKYNLQIDSDEDSIA
ncbi:uncharacterized protein LOC143296081 [Babylonia areolata]|uniref:uncharacterized protein LOC143296081 n=1 Tax=Babylonia areolata TaxID=304850 RepID=UPI003FD227F6